MKKLFLIPLMACFTCVMAWGATITVGEGGTYPATDAGLNSAIAAASAGDVIELTSDIAYATNGTGLINITKSITLDGQGHKLSGWGKCNVKMGSTGTLWATTIAINSGVVGSNLDVTIKNLSLGNTTSNERYYGIIAFDGVAKLTYDNIDIVCGDYSIQQALCFTGIDATPIVLTIKDSHLNSGISAYPVYILKPITANITNTKIEGWCAIYPKYRGTESIYGSNVGSRGSHITCDACTFYCPNSHVGTSNSFALFPFEDDGITLNLHNCSANAKRFTEQYQMIVSLQFGTRAEGPRQPVNVTISGDNSHFYNVDEEWFALSGWNNNDDNDANHLTYTPKYKDAPLHMTITGGTFTVNPSNIKYRNYNNAGDAVVWENAFVDPDLYEVKEVSQGGTTVYRVVKRAAEKTPGVMYNLNDDVPTDAAGAGNNPATSFDLSTGTDMTLNQEITKAGYVEVKDNATAGATTVTVAKNDVNPEQSQTLVINNGLDVQGESQVIVEPTAALVIGEGGIVTSKPENIVIEADKDGAATLLMDPTITVNQTPELTVKMVAQNVGKIGSDYFWHRFALPVDQVNAEDGSWAKDGHSYGTLLYKWDYENNKWASLTNVNQMQPFYGYTMTITEVVADPSALKNAGYIFKGNLTGNVNSVLNFSRQGYNFFGNSYTGYISIVKLIEELIGNENLDGTVWMWNSKRQQYEGVPLNDLKKNPTAGRYTGSNSWKAEVAPMQTFILRLMTEDTETKANINYATAVWGNPRYKDVTGVSLAPARHIESTEDAYVRIVVSAANGKADAINFQEDANLSDANDRGFDAAKYMNERTINVYSTINGENYGTVATDNIEGKKLTINTIDEIAYTISFEEVEGNEYALRDNVTGKVIAIEEGTTYEFAAQPNSVVEGRFEIVSIAKVPTSIENTEVKANAKGIYTIMGQYLGEDFDILPAGVYVVNGVKIVK